MGTKSRIRWSLVVVGLTCMALSWFLSGIESIYTWDHVLEGLWIQDRERYTRTAVLGVAGIVVVALVRLFRKKE